MRICDLRNLGPQSERQLAAIGIHSAEELRRIGAVEAFLALRRAGSGRSLNLLWALVGALEPWPEGRDWREVAASEARLPLLLAVETRESARRAVLAAGDRTAGEPTAGSHDNSRARKPARGRPRGKQPPGEGSADQAGAIWVPGMPFETKKNRR
ncbi:MAG: TfoX/Sxy family DNA transformation protein [Gammaproteobacteria bacterium]|nr:TfoX/Sxy family DNA transformation protein [Gammaproteobacteria bacterium]